MAVNGFDVIQGPLYVPRVGRWVAEWKIDAQDEIEGAVTATVGDGSLTLKGTVDRGGEFIDMAMTRIVGGAGGLDVVATPRHYSSTQARTVISDLLKNGGETLSSTADADLLSTDLDAWTTVALPVGRVFRRLLGRLGSDVSWRTLPDGTIWVGRETWPDSGLTADDFQVLEEDDEHGFTKLGMDVTVMLPGTTLLGRKVSYVRYEFEKVLKVYVWYEDEGSTTDRMDQAMQDAVLSSVPDIDYGAWYDAAVVSQSGNTIDIKPDDPRLPSMGSVPLLFGLPGTSASGVAGGRVLVGWAARDPSRPRAAFFDPTNTVKSLTIAVLELLALGGAPGLPLVTQALLDALGVWLPEFGKYIAGIQGVADPPKAVTPHMAAATTTLIGALAESATTKVTGL